MSDRAHPRFTCLGGPLAGDDAIAILVGEELDRRGIPVALASDASRLLDVLADPGHHVVVDAALGLARGAALVVPARALLRAAPALSSHGLDVGVVVALATHLTSGSGSITLIGIGLGDAPCFDALSPDLRERVPSIADEVLALVSSSDGSPPSHGEGGPRG